MEALMAYVKKIDLTYERVAEVLNYDPDDGAFTWKVDISKNIKTGMPAGCFKGTRASIKTGKQTRYLYIRLDNQEFPAARVAWLLTYKEWPKFNVLYEDGNSENLKLSNLKEGRFKTIKTLVDGRHVHKMSTDTMRHYGLMRYYGIDLAKYQEMLLAQNGVCAICFKPETSVVNGKIKPLAVDHCHNSEKIRGLLCARCNQAVGLFGEDVNVLSNAIEYLRKHSITDTN
jgi:hypothetical protein